MESWQRLLERAVEGLGTLAARGSPVPGWVFGGGTALMVQKGHRRSADVDIFISDPQYLTVLSPRLGGETIWRTADYAEAGHYLKLRYDEGEIDFIVSPSITSRPSGTYTFTGRPIPLDDPVEIAIKKLHHRASGLTPRDIFDIAVVAQDQEAELVANLGSVKHRRETLRRRMTEISEPYYRRMVDALDIFDRWAHLKERALSVTRDIVRRIPAA